MAATVTLKIKFQDTVHRVLLQSHQLTYEAVAETIQEYMSIAKYLDDAVAEIYPGEAIAKYLDEEGDLRVLSAATFSNFLSPSGTEGGNAVLGLELFPAVPALADAQLAECAGPKTAQALHELEGNGKGKGKGKGKWKGKGKGKGKSKCKGSHAGADVPDGNDPRDDLRERQVATGFEDFFHNLSSQCSQWSQWVSRSLKSSTGKCKGKGKGKWKGKRNGAAQPGTDALSPNVAPEAAAAAGDKASSPPLDVPFPVAVGDGRHAAPERNLGSDPQQVAEPEPEEVPTELCPAERRTAAVGGQKPR
jgi:hypothetical protein